MTDKCQTCVKKDKCVIRTDAITIHCNEYEHEGEEDA